MCEEKVLPGELPPNPIRKIVKGRPEDVPAIPSICEALLAISMEPRRIKQSRADYARNEEAILKQSIEIWQEQHGNIAAAARILQIHPSTLRARLVKAGELKRS